MSVLMTYFVGFRDEFPMWAVEETSAERAIQAIAKIYGLDPSTMYAN